MQLLDNSTGLYFYSAVFQGNMALLAFTGVFVVFKLQILTNSLQGKEEQIIAHVKDLCARATGGVPDFVGEMLRDLNTFRANIDAKLLDASWRPSYKPSLQTALNDSALATYFTDRNRLVQSKSQLTKDMLAPFLAIALIVGLALVLLPTAYFIHTKQPLLEVTIIAATVVSNIVALAMNLIFIMTVLKESPGRTSHNSGNNGAPSVDRRG